MGCVGVCRGVGLWLVRIGVVAVALAAWTRSLWGWPAVCGQADARGVGRLAVGWRRPAAPRSACWGWERLQPLERGGELSCPGPVA